MSRIEQSQFQHERFARKYCQTLTCKYGKKSKKSKFDKTSVLYKRKGKVEKFANFAKVTGIFFVIKKDAVTNIARIARITNFTKFSTYQEERKRRSQKSADFAKIAKVTRIFLVLKKDSVPNIVRITRITNLMSIMLPSVPNIAVSCYFCNFCWLQPCQRCLCHLTLEVLFFLLNLLFIKKFVTLANLAIFVILSFLLQVKKSCYFCDSCDIRGLLEGLLCLSS